VNSSSTYVAGRSFIQNAIRHGKGFRLTPDAQALVSAGRPDEFKKAFGDRFVRALFTGGEFCVIARITSISEKHQTKLATSLHAEYNGLVNSGSFSIALDTAMNETNGRTEVSVKVRQVGGQGAELSFTGPDATAIIERLKQFPADVHEHAGGLEAELASYDTIPLPVPTAEQRQDREIVLQDCANQKNGFLSKISEINMALEPRDPPIFANLPPDRNTLIQIQGQYRKALSALIDHAIRVSTGQMDPPQLFVADPAPPAISFTKAPFTAGTITPFLGIWESTDNNGFRQMTIVDAGNNTVTAANYKINKDQTINIETSSEGHMDPDGSLILTIQILVLIASSTLVYKLSAVDPVTLSATETETGSNNTVTVTARIFHRVG
jgi:hypothetical protein